MSKFKVGDKVKRITSSCNGAVINESYIVTSIKPFGITLEGLDGVYGPENFELVEIANMNEFNINDLKTGMRVTLSSGELCIVYTNCCIKNKEATLLLHLGLDGFDSLTYFLEGKKIVKVEVPNTTLGFIKYRTSNSSPHYTTIWEKKQETPEQKELKELTAKMEELTKQSKEITDRMEALKGKV